MTNDIAKKRIASKLKELRLKTGLSIKDVRELLENREIKVAENTLYGYENSVSTPTVNIFLALCDIYQVNNILSEFGYGEKTIPDIPAVYLFWTPFMQFVEEQFGENSKEAFQILRYFAESKDGSYIPLQNLLSGKDTSKILRDLSRSTGIDLEMLVRNSSSVSPNGLKLPRIEDAALVEKIGMLDEESKKEVEGYLNIKLAQAKSIADANNRDEKSKTG